MRSRQSQKPALSGSYIEISVSRPVVAEIAVGHSEATMTFQRIQSINTYGDGFRPANSTSVRAAEVFITPGRDVAGIAGLYVSNRFSGNTSDFVSHFRFDARGDGSVSFQSFVATGGVSPRSMLVTADGSKLVVANQKGDVGLAVFERDVQNGTLGEGPVAAGSMIDIPKAKTGDYPGPVFVGQVLRD
jgi:6-phosphogluconolactonase (cycloisomerase 2 family)